MGTPLLTFFPLIFCQNLILGYIPPPKCRYSEHWAEKAAKKQVATLNRNFIEILNYQEDNYVYSPASIVFALALLEAGAEGETRTDIQYKLGYYSSFLRTEKFFAHGIRSLFHTLIQSSNQNVNFNIANSIFHRDDANIKEGYITEISCLEAEIDTLPFNDDEAIEKLNQWVSDKTNQKIPHLFRQGQINQDIKSVLVNAIYMNAKWQHNFFFDEDVFHSCAARVQTVPFLSKKAYYETWTVAGEVAVGIDYSGLEHQMVLVSLPKDECTKAKRNVNSFARLFFETTTQQEPEKSDFVLKFPKVTLRTKLDLKPILASIGLGSLFSDSANFSRMSDIGLKVGEVVHEAFIKVTENGTEAAAATGIAVVEFVSMELEPIVIKFDRPFLFYIKHKKTKAILFAGRVNTIENSD